jgi:5-(carboxyamino)imidazole ribonucleotide synthase
VILPPAMLGVLGGGQLGRFFVMAAHEMGYRVMVLDPDPHSPAGLIADHHMVADYHDPNALTRMARECTAVTTEFENVPADALANLSQSLPVRPSAAAVGICQNRIVEKSFLRKHKLPHAPYAEIFTAADIAGAPDALFPGILKVARFGYDGKGQVRVANRSEAMTAFHKMQNEPCVLEQMLPLDYEVSVVLARDVGGKVACFPVAENSHHHGILDVSIVPARMGACAGGDAQELAETVAREMDYVGVLAVEFFISRGRLYVNEMAPRPHNSGHYTIDACATSQYEQQVRALCGLPLGDGKMHSAAVMVNLLGDLWFKGGGAEPAVYVHEPAWGKLFAVPGLCLHLYGKREPRPGRKMGHFTVIDSNPEQAQKTAMVARAAIGIVDDA